MKGRRLRSSGGVVLSTYLRLTRSAEEVKISKKASVLANHQKALAGALMVQEGPLTMFKPKIKG